MALCAIVVAIGPILASAPALATEPCQHEHRGHASQNPHRHDPAKAGCAICCVGACVASIAVPARATAAEPSGHWSQAHYQQPATVFAGRDIVPDPSPPRTIS